MKTNITKADKSAAPKKDLPKNKTPLRIEAEEQFNESEISGTEFFEGLSTETVKELFHELRVHQIELEMQNDELIKSRDLLEISRSKYFDLYDLAPVGYLTLDSNGIILESNLKAANILGIHRNSLVRQPFSRFIFNEDFPVYYQNQKKLLIEKILQSYEIRLINSRGIPVNVLLELNILQFGKSTEIYRVIMSDISEYKEAQKKISKLLSEKEVILQEVHHRIKNNLTTVMSILSLHSGRIASQDAIDAIQDAKNRVNTMLILYNKLYCSDNLAELSLKDYLSPLIFEIIQIYPNLEKVKLNTSLDNVPVDIKILPTIGIIVNELITNIAKYAFINRDDGEITISASTVNNHIKLVIIDNGVGIENVMELETSKGLGLELVYLLTQQLDGKITIDGKNGTSFILEFDTKLN